MSWLVDNANALYILGLIIAAALVVTWRFNQRAKFLGLAVIPLLVMGLIFLLTRFVISDSKQLEINVHAMADAVVAGKVDELFKHVSKDFRYKHFDRELLYAAAKLNVAEHRVRGIAIRSFRVEEVSRANRFAKTSFLMRAEAEKEILFRVETDFVLENDQWLLKTMRVYPPQGGDEIDLPGLR
jgi:hypothetical protein